MKWDEIIDEMTMRGGNFDTVAAQFGEKNKDHWFTAGNHVGDIEQFAVKKDGIYYSVWDQEILVAYSKLTDADSEIDDVWVNGLYQNQKIFSKLLWFFKTRLGRDRLQLGKVHSKKMQEVVTGLSRFHKSWFNIRTNQVEPFSPDTMDEFYSWGQITPWRLILENTGDFSDWPKFTEGKSFIYESYTPYID